MATERVFYIQPKSYEHSLSTDEIIDRFISNRKRFSLNSSIESQLYDLFLAHGRFKKTNSLNEYSINIDLVVSQKIMYHLKEFFCCLTKNTEQKKYR
jgi:hypothetical protein